MLDLIRLTPRDSNYQGEEHATRVVRRELMLIHQRTKNLEFATEKMKSEPQEAPTVLEKPAEDASEEVKKKYEEDRAVEIRTFRQQQIKKAEEYIEQAETFKYNVNIYTSAKLVPSADFEKEKADVDNLGKFLLEV